MGSLAPRLARSAAFTALCLTLVVLGSCGDPEPSTATATADRQGGDGGPSGDLLTSIADAPVAADGLDLLDSTDDSSKLGDSSDDAGLDSGGADGAGADAAPICPGGAGCPCAAKGL